MRSLNLAFAICLSFTVSACAGYDTSIEEYASEGTTEQELNQPVQPPIGISPLPEDDGLAPIGSDQAFYFPPWSASSGISKTIYERVQRYYDQNYKNFENKQYVVIIDMGLKSSERRFTLFNLKTGKFSRYLTSHGKNSDPNNDGWLDSFSNVPGSNQTSIGIYKTMGTYYGANGRSLRLDGLESTNSNALSRAIVVHGANYISEANNYAGRSYGCPALDHAVAQYAIDLIKGGSLFVIASSRAI
jgi:hypothetical protein